MCHNVEHVARLGIDDGQTVDPIVDQRVNGIKEGRVGTNTLQLLAVLLKDVWGRKKKRLKMR